MVTKLNSRRGKENNINDDPGLLLNKLNLENKKLTNCSFCFASFALSDKSSELKILITYMWVKGTSKLITVTNKETN